VELVQPLEEGT